MQKLITFAVPCYNSAAYMERAVDSLLAGGEEMEVLIVDDGSTDGTCAALERYKAEHPELKLSVFTAPNTARNENQRNITGPNAFPIRDVPECWTEKSVTIIARVMMTTFPWPGPRNASIFSIERRPSTAFVTVTAISHSFPDARASAVAVTPGTAGSVRAVNETSNANRGPTASAAAARDRYVLFI